MSSGLMLNDIIINIFRNKADNEVNYFPKQSMTIYIYTKGYFNTVHGKIKSIYKENVASASLHEEKNKR